MLQPTPEGKAIWKATVTSESGWSNTFTFLRLSPALIWESGERPDPFAGTVAIEITLISEAADPTVDESTPLASPLSADQEALPSAGDTTAPSTSAVSSMPSPNTASMPDVMDDLLTMIGMESPSAAASGEDTLSITMPEPPAPAPPIPPTELTLAPATSSLTPMAQPSGEHFMMWLKHGVTSHKLIINDTKALVHTVSDTVYLVSPGVFQRYAQEHPQVVALAKQQMLSEWQWVQRRFEKLQLHRKQDSGLNIWTCEVVGPRKSRRLHGYLLVDPSLLFTELPPSNPYLNLV